SQIIELPKQYLFVKNIKSRFVHQAANLLIPKVNNPRDFFSLSKSITQIASLPGISLIYTWTLFHEILFHLGFLK
ncbi:12876_t:CDS:2, partial [Acaulospora morrowiae]